MSKRFKDFLSETSYNSVHNPSAAEGQAAGFADPNVIRKIDWGFGTISPRVWGHAVPEKKKRR